MTCLPLDPADYLVPDWPAPPHVRALCTTRRGGASQGPYATLNLGDHVGDDPEQVVQNRERLHRTLIARPVFLQQVHGTVIQTLETHTPDGTQADGATTTMPGLACTVMVADCLPVLLCDAAGTRVAAVHAGWRGLAGNQGHGVLEQICGCFEPAGPMDSPCEATELIAWLGPCIGPQAFEVGHEVVAAFSEGHPQARSCFRRKSEDKWLADLAGLARQRLRALGVMEVHGNDGSAPWCTVGNPLRFFSHRRDACLSGRMAACVWLSA